MHRHALSQKVTCNNILNRNLYEAIYTGAIKAEPSLNQGEYIYRITSYRMELCDIKIYNYHNEEFMERSENI